MAVTRERFLQQVAAITPVTEAEVHTLTPEGAKKGEYAPPMPQEKAYALWKRLGLAGVPANLGYNLWGGVAVVDPFMAKRWLEEQNRENRSVTLASAHKIASDIQATHWVLTHQSLGFRADGMLQDGQHRVFGVAESGCAIVIMVVLNVTDEAKRVSDDHIRRTAGQAMAIEDGVDYHPIREQMMKAAYFGLRSHHDDSFTRSKRIALLERHREALDWVEGQFQAVPQKLRKAPVMAAVLRAYYSVDRKRLEQFCQVLVDGQASNRRADGAAVMLYKDLLDGSKSKSANRNGATRYAVATRAIAHFIVGETPNKRIAPIKKEMWDLPENTDTPTP